MRAPARLQGIQHWGTVVLPRAWLQPGIGAPAGVRAALVWGRDDAGAERAAGLRILMVEDDEALSQMYATRLRRDGHDVTTVGDGESGLKAALLGLGSVAQGVLSAYDGPVLLVGRDAAEPAQP